MSKSGLLAKTVLVLAALLGGEDRAVAQVSVSLERLQEGGWSVEGSFFVECSSALVWDVLTDYERIPDFVRSLKTSRLQGRMNGHFLLEQEARAGFFFFRRAVRVLLKVHERPMEKIQFEDLSLKDFTAYHGSWTLREEHGGTVVDYSLQAHPAFNAPAFAEKRALRKTTRALLESVRDEMRTRGHRESR